MEHKTLVCPICKQTKVLVRDSNTGLWELLNEYSTISNLSFEYLAKSWLRDHTQNCQSNKDGTADIPA